MVSEGVTADRRACGARHRPTPRRRFLPAPVRQFPVGRDSAPRRKGLFASLRAPRGSPILPEPSPSLSYIIPADGTLIGGLLAHFSTRIEQGERGFQFPLGTATVASTGSR